VIAAGLLAAAIAFRGGVNLPTMGATYVVDGRRDWNASYRRYFSPAVMDDIARNLHAGFVRTGWIPNWERRERVDWSHEDQVMDSICAPRKPYRLGVVVIVPGPKDDALGESDLLANVGEFFGRYTAREPGCAIEAEIANEANLSVNGFGGVEAYAAYYETVAPIVASYGVAVITSGSSGEDLHWFATLRALFARAVPAPPLLGYGFHPYDVGSARMGAAVDAVAAAAGVPASRIYVTEIGDARPRELEAILDALARAGVAMISVYQYAAQPNEPTANLALRENPALYRAVAEVFARVNGPVGTRSPP